MIGGGASVNDTVGKQSQLRNALAEGLDVIDENATVTFNLYRRMVLPLDGFVFWVRADIIKPGALPPLQYPASLSFEAQGSLHHTTINRQDPDESFSTHRMIFTSKDKVQDLADVAPETMYLAETHGMRYTFSSRTMWYKQAALYHYAGDAVYPTMASQIIERVEDLNLRDVVVSNSMPIWLQFNKLFPVYPALLVPDNIEPPYAVVNISEEDTTPLQAAPIYAKNRSRFQLVKDNVRIVTYGVRNNTIMDWIDMVQDYALGNPGIMGVMNSPIPKDGHRGQTEISAIAQKKVTVFDVNYYQARMQNVARKLINEAFIGKVFTTI